MIIRQIISRQGRRLATKPRTPLTKTFATQVDQAELELQTRLQEQLQLQNELETQSSYSSQASTDTPATKEPIDKPLTLSEKLIKRHKVLEHQDNTSGQYGATNSPHYKPYELLTRPPRPSDITIELLLASQAHMGHATSLWNPKNSRYIFGVRQGMHIISLEQTAAHLRRACRVVAGVAERAGLVLFVGTRAGQERTVVAAAKMAGGYHLFTRWTPGSITNGQQILNRCEVRAVDPFDREIDGLKEELAENAPALKPDLVVCLNPMENWVLLH
ncbi:MAG: hypothetical protein LQ340_000906, partial [Diploschistes diacapsis]